MLAALGTVGLVALGRWAHDEWEGKYEADFVGETEHSVVSSLGPPVYDERAFPGYPKGHPYTLGWYFAIGRQLVLELDRGIVIRQRYGAK